MSRLPLLPSILAAALLTQTAANPQQDGAAAVAAGQQHSTMTIHVQKSGLFSAFGHNHVITAPVRRGVVDRKLMSAEIVVATQDMKVLDPEGPEKDIAEVQQNMLGPKVLDSQKFKEIWFQTTHVQEMGNQRYRISGKLQLHGVAKDMTFDASGGPDHYHGKTKLKQTDFGIQPISGGGGTVKVKDEVEIEFDIYPAELSQP